MLPRSVWLVPLAAMAACGHPPAKPAQAGDATATRHATPGAPPGPRGCPDDPAAATADANLAAMVSQGEALPDHVGPDAAAAAFADLDAHPARYLDRFECRFVAPDPGPGYTSLLLATPLWRLRRHDPERVAALAARVVLRYRQVATSPPDPATDPGFGSRLAERLAVAELIRDGVDVAAGPGWKAVAPSDVSACLTATPDSIPVVRVTRACTCGEALACRLTAAAGTGAVDLEVRYDPDSYTFCTDCYPVSTACRLPALPAGASLTLRTGGGQVATWTTDARGWPTGITCPR